MVSWGGDSLSQYEVVHIRVSVVTWLLVLTTACSGKFSVRPSLNGANILPSVAEGTLVATLNFYGMTSGCDFSPPSVTFTAPATGTYWMYSYVDHSPWVRDGVSPYALSTFYLLGFQGDTLIQHELTKDPQTQFLPEAYPKVAMWSSVRLNQGERYQLVQYYHIDCAPTAANSNFKVTLGTSQIYLEAFTDFLACEPDELRSLPLANPFTSTQVVEGTYVREYMCLNTGVWVETGSYDLGN